MRRASLYPLTFAVSAFLCAAAFAAGDPAPQTPAPKCKAGEVWDEKDKKCKAAKQGAVDDDSLYQAARDLAYAEQPEAAIKLLKLAKNPRDPRILNYLGYAHRKLGQMDEAFAYYNAAVAEKPDYTLVREYLGEAHLQIGDLAGAKVQLAAIKRYCEPGPCLEYKDLAEEIAEYERQQL